MNFHFDLLASIYDRAIGPPRTAWLTDLLRLPAAGRMLDAGGGTGRVSSQFSHLIDNVVLCDLSHSMLRQAQEKNALLPVQGRSEYLPFPDESFDRVLVVDALHHFTDQPTAVADLLRVVRRGGRLVIEEPNIYHAGVKLIALAEKLALMGSHFHKPEEIRTMVAGHGIPARVETNGTYAAWIVADKE